MSMVQSLFTYFHQHRVLTFLATVPLITYSLYFLYTRTLQSPKQTLVAYPKKSIRNDYILGKLLGKGSFSTVRIATHIRTQKQYAAKIINLRKLDNPIIDLIYNEINILRQIQHANIISLHDYYVEPNFIYIILEYLPGGELFDVISKMQYSEADIRQITITLLKTLAYLHEHNIVHRDLKPENLLLSESLPSTPLPSDGDNPLTHLKIADFGFAAMATIPLTSQCGTPEYAAPELLLNQPYSTPVDVWALGVVVYVLLVGYTPFSGSNYKELYHNIKQGNYSFDDPLWDAVSAPAKDFIRHLLVVNPEERYTAQQALQHPWLTDTTASTTRMSGNRKQLRRYVLKKKFRAAVRVVVAIYRMKKALSAFGHADTP